MYRPPREERINTATHAIGVVLALLSAVWLIPTIWSLEDRWLFWSVVSFHLAAIGVYASSTLSHYYTDARQRLFRKADQAFIYLLIVASYTPMSIAYLKSDFWWFILAVMWSLGTAGFVSKLFVGHRVQQVSIWIYLFLGWLPVMTGMPFQAALDSDALFWFVFGGVMYTAGTAFLFNDMRVWYFHAIWHLMVIGGTASHLVMILHCLPESA